MLLCACQVGKGNGDETCRRVRPHRYPRLACSQTAVLRPEIVLLKTTDRSLKAASALNAVFQDNIERVRVDRHLAFIFRRESRVKLTVQGAKLRSAGRGKTPSPHNL
jgi:hypothetical protein